MPTNLNAKTSYIGTCQACFAQQVVRATRGRAHTLVLHGYVRPGFGYITGECMGVNELPYELSCEATKHWKAECKARVAGLKLDLLRYECNECSHYCAVVPDRDVQVRWGKPAPTKIVKLGLGETYVDSKYGQTWTFEGQRQQAIKTTKRDIKELQETIAFLDERIAAWVYAPEALKDHATVRREARAARDEEKLAAGFRRNWKELWKYVAEAIQSHKDSVRRVAELSSDEAKAGFARWQDPAEGETHRQKLIAEYSAKFANLPAFPTDKERAAARKGVK